MTDILDVPDMRRRRSPRPRSGLLRRGVLVVAALIVLIAVLWASFPSVFATASPYDVAPLDRYLPPSPEHWFGTDNLGRDVFSRTVHGSAVSLQAALIAVLVGAGFGTIIGAVSGLRGGVLDAVLMRLVDVTLAIPSLLLSLLVVTALGFGTVNVAIAVGVGSIASFARVMRAEAMKVRTSAYVEAARVSGVRSPRILSHYILPNASGPALALAGLEFASAILAVAALGFLGFGAAPPAPEWGSMIADGRNFLAAAWWMTTLPGLVVVIVVLAANSLARSAYRRFP